MRLSSTTFEMRSKVLQDILDKMDPETAKRVEERVRQMIDNIPEDAHIRYGTPESYMLLDMISKGFKPIAITVMACEETFVFRGSKEAKDTWEIYKNEGWWYGLDGFIKERIDYVKDLYKGKIEDAPIVYWLDKNYEQEI
jgi:hypothetical protein